jgi:hypothetical protein
MVVSMEILTYCSLFVFMKHQEYYCFIKLQNALYEFPNGFWWTDSSIRWFGTDDLQPKVYGPISDGGRSPYTLIDYTGHSIYAATNPGVCALSARAVRKNILGAYKYFPVDVNKLKTVGMWGGGFVFAVRAKISIEVVRW